MAQVLGRVPTYENPNVLVGYETADDAGVFRIDRNKALVQTLDFFTPVVDEPYAYGAIAAANSLSDVYAMGGKPITAMAIACFPEGKMELEVLAQIMSGGIEKLREAGVALLGGHTVLDPEIKFGYSITGLIDPEHILRNSTALPGDALVLTKPLGIGILTSGIKLQKTPPAAIERAIAVMTSLNRTASEIMMRYRCHAATDITGNGLLGHAYEMALGSRVMLRFQSKHIPFIPEAYPLAEEGFLPRTVRTTWSMIEKATWVAPHVPDPIKNILLDPQTSGGLLIAVDPADLDALLKDMTRNHVEAACVGTVEKAEAWNIWVE